MHFITHILTKCSTRIKVKNALKGHKQCLHSNKKYILYFYPEHTYRWFKIFLFVISSYLYSHRLCLLFGNDSFVNLANQLSSPRIQFEFLSRSCRLPLLDSLFVISPKTKPLKITSITSTIGTIFIFHNFCQTK